MKYFKCTQSTENYNNKPTCIHHATMIMNFSCYFLKSPLRDSSDALPWLRTTALF